MEKEEKNLEKKIKQIEVSMKIHSIYENVDRIQLVPFGDVHYGAKECDIKRAKKTIGWIKDHKDARVILMGDMLNSATRGSVGAGTFDESTSGQAQYDFMVDLLKPIKHKIYGGFIGNHEFRAFKETGYNITKMMAKELGHKYYGFGCFMKLQVKDQNYVIYGTHGSSGATLPYTKIKRALDMGRYIDSDILLYAHVHSLQVHTQEHKHVNLRNKTVEKTKRYYVLTGHYLKYEDSYAEQKNIMPEKEGSPTIILTGGKEGRHIRVIV